MTGIRVGTAATVLAVVVLYAVLSSRWTSQSSRWYAGLPRPSWQPPDLVFGGDFEHQVNWFYGASQERPFRVIYVDGGRVAVDIIR